MARKPREQIEGGMYHVYARGNRKADIFRDDVDYRSYLRLLERTVRRHRWSCLGYCLMPNHVHLLVATLEANLARGMQQLHGPYAQAFNARHGEVGHVFQGRYGAVRITDDRQLLTTVGYVAVNPVVGGLCAGVDRWPWSSHRAIAEGGRPGIVDRDRLFACLEGWSGGEGKARYDELVASRLRAAAATEGTGTP
jgi:putative transposase